MITKFKIFESNNEPQKGDYVYAYDNVEYMPNEEIFYFLQNNIGKFVGIMGINLYIIEYENVPKGLNLGQIEYGYTNRRSFFRNEIKFFSPNKEEVEIEMNAAKYNL